MGEYLRTDFFYADGVLLRRYHTLFIIEVDSRVVHLLGVTTNQAMAWVTQVARNFTADLEEAGRRFPYRSASSSETDFEDLPPVLTLSSPQSMPSPFAHRFVHQGRRRPRNVG